MVRILLPVDNRENPRTQMWNKLDQNTTMNDHTQETSVKCSDGGAGGGGAIPSRLKKKGGGEKDVDLRPHTYVRTRGAKYRC